MIADDKLYKLTRSLGHGIKGGLIIGSGLRELMCSMNIVEDQVDEYAICLEEGEVHVK